MAMDVKSIKPVDMGGLIAGVLVFILSLIPAWVTFDVEGADSELFDLSGVDTGVNAWQEINVLALLLLLLATAVVAVKVFAPQALPSTLPVGLGVVATGLAAVGTLILVIKTLAQFESQESLGVSVSAGPGWSGWLLMIAAVALTVGAALGMKESGEPLPWQSGSTGTRASTPGAPHAQPTTPPPAGQQAPPASQPPPAAPPTAPPAAPPTAPPTAEQPPVSPPPGDEGAPPRPPA